MAGLDTSIALGIKPVDFGDPNEGRMNALRAQMMQMQMQQGQFNMMKAQRDMEYQNQQRAAAAAAVARDKAAEAQALKLYGQTGAPGYQAYSPSMEPGAASDVGMLGGGQGYTEGAVNRLAMPAQPKNFDDAITTALQSGKIDPTVVRKLMALKEAQNVYTKSNLGVDEATLKNKKGEIELAKADLERGAKAIEFHASALPTVTPETWGAWRSNAVKDLPGLDQILPQTAPADPVAFDQLKRSLILKAQDSVKQHYQTITDGDQTRTVGINPITQQATPIPGTEGKSKTAETLSDVGRLIKERNALDKNAPDYQELLEIYNDRIAKANAIKGEGGTAELKPAEKFRIEQGLSKSYSAATSILDTLENAHDAVQNVQGSNLAGTTGVSAYIPSIPGGAAATSENRMETLKGRVTAMGKAAVASTGAIGSIATQEWKILTNMVAALDPGKGEKAYREALDDVEAQIQTSKNRIRDAYEKAHVDTLKRPEFQQYGALPEPRERGGVMPGSNPNAQKPAVSRVQPNTPGGAPYAPGARVPAAGAPASGPSVDDLVNQYKSKK
jgi:hypothetical protein